MAGDGSLSLDALQQVTGGMLELNHEVIKLILEVKQDEFKSKSFLSLMKAYMEASLRNLDLCYALERCIKYVRVGQSVIQQRLQEAADDGGQNKTLMMRTKEELTKLKTEVDPFPQHLSFMIDSAQHGLESLITESDKQIREFDRTLRRIKTWSKLSTVLFAIGYFSVLILTGVTFLVNVPSPVEVLAGALLATIGSIGKWTNYYYKQEEKRIRGLKDSLNPVNLGAQVMLRDMDNIRIIIEKWKTGIEGLMQKADAVLREEEETEEMMKMWEAFKGISEELARNVAKIAEDTRRARAIPLQKIMQLNSSDEEKGNCLEIIM